MVWIFIKKSLYFVHIHPRKDVLRELKLSIIKLLNLFEMQVFKNYTLSKVFFLFCENNVSAINFTHPGCNSCFAISVDLQKSIHFFTLFVNEDPNCSGPDEQDNPNEVNFVVWTMGYLAVTPHSKACLESWTKLS